MINYSNSRKNKDRLYKSVQIISSNFKPVVLNKNGHLSMNIQGKKKTTVVMWSVAHMKACQREQLHENRAGLTAGRLHNNPLKKLAIVKRPHLYEGNSVIE